MSKQEDIERIVSGFVSIASAIIDRETQLLRDKGATNGEAYAWKERRVAELTDWAADCTAGTVKAIEELQ